MFYLAWRNLGRRLAQTVTTAVIIVLTIGVLIASFATITALYDGMKLSSARLGADIIVLPKDIGVSSSAALFTAEPANIYLPDNAIRVVTEVPGIDLVSPQFFTQTLNQSCCSVMGATRVVGLDEETDFTVSPWIEGSTFPELGSDGIVLGHDVEKPDGDVVMILGNQFFVKGTLEPTGTSVDGTVFMSLETARRIGAQSPYLESVWKQTDPNTSISALLVRVKDGEDASFVAHEIETVYPGASAVVTSSVMQGVANQFELLVTISLGLSAALLVISVLALVGRVSALINGRRTEIGFMRAIGLQKQSVIAFVLVELGIVAVLSGIVGAVLGIFLSNHLVGALHSAFALPEVGLTTLSSTLLVGAGVAVALVLGVGVALVPLLRLIAHSPQEIITRGDL